MVTDRRILVPEKLYVGVKANGYCTEMMSASGWLTAWGTDNAAVKRMATVDAWSSNNHVLDNVPLTGFTLRDHYKNDWLVSDPRGFITTVTASAISELINTATVVNGSVVNPCVWARENGSNVLLSVHSDLHRLAVTLTRIANSRASWKHARAGNTVTLTNGLQGVYLGKFHSMCLNTHRWSKAQDQNRMEFTDQPHIVIAQPHTAPGAHNITHVLHYLTTAKLAEINNTDVLTAAQAEQALFDHQPTASLSVSGRFGIPRLSSMSAISANNVELVLTDHPHTVFAQAVDHGALYAAMGGLVIATLKSGVTCLVQFKHARHVKYSGTVIDASELANNKFIYVLNKDHYPCNTEFDLADVVDHRSLTVKLTTAAGVTLERML